MGKAPVVAGSAGAVLRRALVGQRWWVLLGAILTMAHQAAEALVLVVVGEAIDRAVVPGDFASLALWVGLLALLFAGLSAAGCVGWWVNERATLGASHEVRMWVTGRALDPGGFAERGAPPGELVSLATSDADQVGDAAEATAFLAGALSALAVSAVVLFGISTSLGLIVLLGLPPLLILIRLFTRPLARRTVAEQAAVARAAGVATDLISGLRVLKGLGAEAAASARYRTASRSSLKAALASARVESAGLGVLLALTGAFLAIVALVGGRLAASGEISIGQFIAAVGLAQFLVGPLSNLAEVATIFARARASAQRVSEFLSVAPAVTDISDHNGARPPLRPGQGTIALRGVSHGGRLRGLDLDIRAGEILGVAAANGEDADALIALLAREADPDAGTVTLDGVPFASASLDELRGTVLVAPHHADLFSGTLADNVHPDPEQLDLALASAGADEVAGALPGGTGTLLGEGGRTLSGGQRQRVALARALAAGAPVLVLHDPTTAVDALTEHRIASRLPETRAGRTTVLVATSPVLLAATDRVVLLEGGAVSVEGTHGTLVTSSASYRAAVLS